MSVSIWRELLIRKRSGREVFSAPVSSGVIEAISGREVPRIRNATMIARR